MKLLINPILKTVKGQFWSHNLHYQRVTEYHIGDIVIYVLCVLRNLLFRQTNTQYINNKIRLFISVINQLDAQNFCFTIRLFHVSTCIERMCSSSGGQNCIPQPQ